MVSSYKYWVSAFLMGAAVYGTQFLLTPCIANTFLLITEGGILYFLLVILMKDELMLELVKALANKISLKKRK